MSFTAVDVAHMAEALRLAEQGLYSTRPNPRVGCVIAQGEQVLGRGWHVRAGEPHAEVFALREAGERARGATAYVTLEPCSHHGRTPPCAAALQQAGVARVVAALVDPNPLVAGRGLAQLAAAGITTAHGLLADAAREQNCGFLSRMERGRPWLRSKLACSLDGKTALANGDSQWITGPAARLDVQRWRARSCALLTGIGTVLADDPRLTVRELAAPQPWRIVLDRQLRTPLNAAILQGGNTLLVTGQPAPERVNALREAGAEVLALPDGAGGIDLAALLNELARRQFNEVTVEAGAQLNGALLAADLLDEVVLYQAPVWLGGGARELFAAPHLDAMSRVPRWQVHDRRAVGDDWRLVLRRP